MGSFKLVESFVSINGEGQRAGELALFMRFAGCNLRCDWCDTMWANREDVSFTLCSTEELVDKAKRAVSENGIKNVTLTGGEPLLQGDIKELVSALTGEGLRVEIETNGAVSLDCLDMTEKSMTVTMDYKLPSSKMESMMCTEDLGKLRKNDTLKFVCASGEDLERAAEVLERYAPVCRVYLSPVFGRIEPAEMVEFIKEKKLGDVRLQLQLHKFIWDPDMRGV